jgi:site-specific recombinase XerD
MSNYDQQVEAIRSYNQPILDEFKAWLEAKGLAKKTVKNHVDNIDFFADFLVYYEPLEKLNEATEIEVYSFLSDWFPRKAMWASPASVKSYMASFRKFFKFMVESNRIDSKDEQAVRESLKECRDEFIEAAKF